MMHSCVDNWLFFPFVCSFLLFVYGTEACFPFWILSIFLVYSSRKMQVPGSADSASRSQSGSDLNYVKPKEELDDSKLDMKIRCLCGSSLVSESMIKVYVWIVLF